MTYFSATSFLKSFVLRAKKCLAHSNNLVVLSIQFHLFNNTFNSVLSCENGWHLSKTNWSDWNFEKVMSIERVNRLLPNARKKRLHPLKLHHSPFRRVELNNFSTNSVCGWNIFCARITFVYLFQKPLFSWCTCIE